MIIISGGQTGADQGGLEAGRALCLQTGGWAPRGFKTENGSDFSLRSFGLIELGSDNYRHRTEHNVVDSDGTVLFGNDRSPGSRFTRRMCAYRAKPLLAIPTPGDEWTEPFLQFLVNHKIETLNVAGNRESKTPGIQRSVKEFIVSALSME